MTHHDQGHGHRFRVWHAAIAAGLVWGLGLFTLGLIATGTAHYGHAFINAIGSVYWGYDATIGGAFLGLMWGFLDVGIAVLIFSLVYHWLGMLPHHEVHEQPHQEPQTAH